MEDRAYRIYISDVLKMIAEGDCSPTQRYIDLITKKKDTRTGEQIVEDIVKGAGLRLI